MKDLKESMESRRSYYALSDKSLLTDSEIKSLIDHAVLHVPSAFNSQSARLVLLLGEHHRRLWDIVKGVLEKIVPAPAFATTKAKIEGSFQSGYGTVLFFEDRAVVEGMQAQFPPYADNFPVWSEHTSAMHQYAVWMLLENAGFGASLQHYNPIIDEEVAAQWNIDPRWRLRAQMPFGVPIATPGHKEFQPLENRSIVFK